jgi:hypothetical protein
MLVSVLRIWEMFIEINSDALAIGKMFQWYACLRLVLCFGFILATYQSSYDSQIIINLTYIIQLNIHYDIDK